jgi:hypothetical protein
MLKQEKIAVITLVPPGHPAIVNLSTHASIQSTGIKCEGSLQFHLVVNIEAMEAILSLILS